MSFIPGLSDDIEKAWNGVKGAVGNAWDWLTGSSESEADDIAQGAALANDPQDENPLKPITEVDPVLREEMMTDSLTANLGKLRVEAMNICEDKARKEYLKLREHQEKNKELTNLLQVFTQHADNTGTIEIKDEETKLLLTKAKFHGVKLPHDKLQFTKSERDSIIHNIDFALKVVSDDMRIGFNDAQEALNQRNTFYQELKTCWDKIVEAIRKIIHAISPR